MQILISDNYCVLFIGKIQWRAHAFAIMSRRYCHLSRSTTFKDSTYRRRCFVCDVDEIFKIVPFTSKCSAKLSNEKASFSERARLVVLFCFSNTNGLSIHFSFNQTLSVMWRNKEEREKCSPKEKKKILSCEKNQKNFLFFIRNFSKREKESKIFQQS